jgi:DNA (cytosine-5)-methyltransferase 1
VTPLPRPVGGNGIAPSIPGPRLPGTSYSHHNYTAARHMRKPWTVLSLFSGIGGLELGLERSGMRVVGQVESSEYCRAVLARHWPNVPRHDDVRTAPEWWASTRRPAIAVVAGGFPCQPFSMAGHLRNGIDDDRWLWPAMFRVITAVRPQWVITENVPALLHDVAAYSIILNDLSASGFDVQWDVVSACALGASHTRRRLFTVAHAHGAGRVARRNTRRGGLSGPAAPQGQGHYPAGHHRWPDEPVVHRVAYGFPGRVDRVTALGNAVVPAVAQHLGHLMQDEPAHWITP